jgi:hypothetical protein
MHRDLLRLPLQRVLILLWLVGMVQWAVWPLHRPVGAAWIGSALCAALLGVLVAGRLRRASLLPVAALPGLAAVLGLATLAEVPGTGLAVLTVLYGLLLWLGVSVVLGLPSSARVLPLLGFTGGWGRRGGRQAVQSAVQWCCLGLVLSGCLASPLAWPGWDWTQDRGGLPAGVPSALALGLVYLGLAWRRERRVLHVHLGAALTAWLALSLEARRTASRVVPIDDPLAGPLLGCVALLCLATAHWIVPATAGADRAEDQAAPGTAARQVLIGWALALLSLTAVQAVALPASGLIGPIACAIAAIGFLASGQMLRGAVPTLAGAALAVLSLCWAYTAVVWGVPPFGLYPGGPAGADQWLLLALCVLGLAVIARSPVRAADWLQVHAAPLLWLGWALCGWSCMGALMLLKATPQGAVTLALVWPVLAAAVFLLLEPAPWAGPYRGAAAAVMTTLLAMSALGPAAIARGGAPVPAAWAAVLWALGTLVLPRLDRWLGRWVIAWETWAWTGLAVLILAALWAGPGIVWHWQATLGAAVYLLLMARHTRWPVHWLAVAAFAGTGLLWGLAGLTGTAGLGPRALAVGAIEGLLWANLLLLCIPVWERYGAIVSRSLGLPPLALRLPLLIAALVSCLIWMAAVVLAVWLDASGGVWSGPLGGGAGVPVAVATLVLVLGCLHLLWRWRIRPAADLLILAATLALLTAWNLVRPGGLSLLGALWCLLLASPVGLPGGRGHWLGRLLRVAAGDWLAPAFLVAFGLLWVPLPGPFGERLAALALLTAVAAFTGWYRASRTWFGVALGLGVVLMHALWLTGWTDGAALYGRLSLFALQDALLVWVLVWASGRADRAGADAAGPLPPGALALAAVAAGAGAWVGALAATEWAGQGVLLAWQATGRWGGPPAWPATLTYAATTALLAGLCLRQARPGGPAVWVYAAAALIGTAALCLRLAWFGPVPPGPADTAAIMGAAYATFLLGRFTGSRPVLHLTLLLPPLALLTVFGQSGTGGSAVTLLAAGALYLLTHGTLHTRTPLYLGLLAVNAAIYLWVPDWSARFGLLQVYLVPAALTVLLLLHLHHHELGRRTLHSARLATLAVLYAAAALDVFQVEDLWVFALAMAISLGAVLIGIGLRVRAFLYVGVVFLVLNVAGQLIQFYPAHRLGRALMLMGLGAVITGLMLWFSFKRERIMEQVRVFRADLAQWE